MSDVFTAAIDELARMIAIRLTATLEPQQHATEQRSPWMNIGTAAAYLDWPRQRLYKLTACGAIPHYKHDGRLLFHRAELDTWLRDHHQPATG